MNAAPQLFQNAIYIPEADLYIASWGVHDFIEYRFEDGATVAIDGGLAYCRRAGDLEKLTDERRYQEVCLNEESAFEDIANTLLWGTRGINGDKPLTYRPIKEFSVPHLQAILDNCPQRNACVDKVVRYWLEVKSKASVA